MSYDLKPNKKGLESFHFGAFSWGPLLSACGLLWPAMFNGGQWYCVWDVDPRLTGDYPALMTSEGMEITEEEAKIMARCARNLVVVQRSLPTENADESVVGRKEGINREQLLELLAKTVSGGINQKWPLKLRSDFVDRYEQFAEWADKSGGFKIF